MDKDKKKRKLIDKILMGAVIGGAIGSVVGASMRKKEEKKVTEEMAETAKDVRKKSGIFFKKVKRLIKREKGLKEIPHEMEEK